MKSTLTLISNQSVFSTWPKSQAKKKDNYLRTKVESLKWNKKHFSSLLKGFHWSKQNNCFWKVRARLLIAFDKSVGRASNALHLSINSLNFFVITGRLCWELYHLSLKYSESWLLLPIRAADIVKCVRKYVDGISEYLKSSSPY